MNGSGGLPPDPLPTPFAAPLSEYERLLVSEAGAAGNFAAFDRLLAQLVDAAIAAALDWWPA